MPAFSININQNIMEETKRDIARAVINKYLEIAKEKKTSFSKRFIANVLFSEHPDLFKTYEDARSVIIKIMGGSGVCSTKNKDLELRAEWLLLEQPVVETIDEPYVVAPIYKKAFVINDIHSRFYDREAVYAAINYGIREKCDICIINGDLLDFYQFSKFDKNPDIMRYFMSEREWAQDFLGLLQKTFGKVIFKKGNHDIRREQYIHNKLAETPEVAGMLSLSDYLFFEGSNVEILEDTQVIEFGKLNIIHGHEYVGGGIHIAYNRLNKAFDNVLSGHSHVTQQALKKTLLGDTMGSWSVGCLCNLHPRYNPKNNWNHGFAIVEREENGNFIVQNSQIIKGRVF